MNIVIILRSDHISILNAFLLPLYTMTFSNKSLSLFSLRYSMRKLLERINMLVHLYCIVLSESTEYVKLHKWLDWWVTWQRTISLESVVMFWNSSCTSTLKAAGAPFSIETSSSGKTNSWCGGPGGHKQNKKLLSPTPRRMKTRITK